MQEQNFEKQVQDTLRELSLAPSVPVWQKVEQEIRQKKKRRRVLAFWLLAVLLTGGGAFWAFYSTSGVTSGHTAPSLSATSSPLPQPAIPTTEEAITIDTDRKEPAPAAKTSTTTLNSSAPATHHQEKTSMETVAEKTNAKEKPVLAIHTPAAKTWKKQSRPAGSQNASTTQTKQSKAVTNTSIEAKEVTTAIPTNPEDREEENSSGNQAITDQPFDTVATAITAEPALPQQETLTSIPDSTQNKKGQKKTAKWSWAVAAGYGMSSLQEDFLSEAKGAPEAYSDRLSNGGSPVSPPQSFTSTPGPKKGAAFHLGFSAKRHLNKRFAVTTGLRYRYFSTKNKVGQTVVQDTVLWRAQMASVALNQYFRAAPNGPLNDYTNKYHFVELPAGIEWQLHRRLPLHLQTGVSLSYLVATNALVFDPTAGIYYKNNNQFRKTQLHVYSGLTYRLWHHKGLGIHVGPYLQFGISGLQKENTSRHLLATGLKTQLSF